MTYHTNIHNNAIYTGIFQHLAGLITPKINLTEAVFTTCYHRCAWIIYFRVTATCTHVPSPLLPYTH